MCAAATRADIVEEGTRLVEAARARGLVLRLLGGAAIKLRSAADTPEALTRSIQDLDFATTKGQGRHITAIFTEHGYVPSQSFNAIHGARRMLFEDPARDRYVDIFVASFEMCHSLPLTDRLRLDSVTVPLAELAMTKLQIVALNKKDMLDLYALFLSHDVGSHDDDTINGEFISKVASADWGLFHTFELNLARLGRSVDEMPLSSDKRELITTRIQALADMLIGTHKSIRWQLRAQIGERLRWYEEPDEIAHERERLA